MKTTVLWTMLLIGNIAMANTNQTIRLPDEDDNAGLAKQRIVVEKYLPDDAREKYKTSAGKLGLLRALLDANTFKTNQTYELQCMGIVLGDVFVQEMAMQWVIVEDANGKDPAVRVPNTSIIIFPLTMISKRVERGEKVDVFGLFNGLADQIVTLKTKEKASEPSAAPLPRAPQTGHSEGGR